MGFCYGAWQFRSLGFRVQEFRVQGLGYMTFVSAIGQGQRCRADKNVCTQRSRRLSKYLNLPNPTFLSVLKMEFAGTRQKSRCWWVKVGFTQSYKYPKWSYPNIYPTYNQLTKSPGPPSMMHGQAFGLNRVFGLGFRASLFRAQGFRYFLIAMGCGISQGWSLQGPS